METGLDESDLRSISAAYRGVSGEDAPEKGTVRIKNVSALREFLLKKSEFLEGAFEEGEEEGGVVAPLAEPVKEPVKEVVAPEQPRAKWQEPVSGNTKRISGITDLRADLQFALVRERLEEDHIDVSEISEEELPAIAERYLEQIDHDLFYREGTIEEQLARAEQLTPTLVTASIEDLDRIRGVLYGNVSGEKSLLASIASLAFLILGIFPWLVLLELLKDH